jgi:hypothetical protein
VKEIVMPATTRFDLKMDAEEKDIVSRAAGHYNGRLRSHGGQRESE